jgi:hypothetical protein
VVRHALTVGAKHAEAAHGLASSYIWHLFDRLEHPRPILKYQVYSCYHEADLCTFIASPSRIIAAGSDHPASTLVVLTLITSST